MTTSSDARRSPRRAPAPGHRQVDADRTRAALLDAALDEFAAKGFAGARVRDIAQRAGVSKDLLARYVHDALADPRPMRLLAWRGLASPDDSPPDGSPPAEDLSGTRARQQRGELPADIDPAVLRLVLLAAVAAPVVFPDQARKLFGTVPDDPEFETRYASGLRRLIAHLTPEGRQ